MSSANKYAKPQEPTIAQLVAFSVCETRVPGSSLGEDATAVYDCVLGLILSSHVLGWELIPGAPVYQSLS